MYMQKFAYNNFKMDRLFLYNKQRSGLEVLHCRVGGYIYFPLSDEGCMLPYAKQLGSLCQESSGFAIRCSTVAGVG